MTSHVQMLKNLKCRWCCSTDRNSDSFLPCGEIHVSRAILFCVIVIKVGDAANTKPIFTSLINQQVIKKWMQPAAK